MGVQSSFGFTLGTLTEAEDTEVRLALAISPEGDVDGFLSWLPVYGRDGAVRGWHDSLPRTRVVMRRSLHPAGGPVRVVV